MKLIVGNGKMNGDADDAKRLAIAIRNDLGDSINNCVDDRVSVAICPPFPYLPMVREILRGSRVSLGAQNLFPESNGAFTGEVSPTMLVDLECKYVIIGHSERRKILGETNEFINKKVKSALAAGLHVIFCVGETLDERSKHPDAGVVHEHVDSTERVGRRRTTTCAPPASNAALIAYPSPLVPPETTTRTSVTSLMH